jgi:hypothetical protein
MTEKGHEGKAALSRLSGCCRFDEATVAGVGREEEDAPKSALVGDRKIDGFPRRSTFGESSAFN